jgi:hypothetical protein
MSFMHDLHSVVMKHPEENSVDLFRAFLAYLLTMSKSYDENSRTVLHELVDEAFSVKNKYEGREA